MIIFMHIRFIGINPLITSERNIVNARAIIATHKEMLSDISSLYHVTYFLIAMYKIMIGTAIIRAVIIISISQYRIVFPYFLLLYVVYIRSF